MSKRPPENPAPLAYSIKGLSAATTISVSSLYEMMSDGRLQYVKIGSRRLIPASSAHKLIGEAA